MRLAETSYGDRHVALGSDQMLYELKGRPPVNSEEDVILLVLRLKI